MAHPTARVAIWKLHPDLMIRATTAQNAMPSQDHLTIIGFFDTEAEFRKHVDYLEAKVAARGVRAVRRAA